MCSPRLRISEGSGRVHNVFCALEPARTRRILVVVVIALTLVRCVVSRSISWWGVVGELCGEASAVRADEFASLVCLARSNWLIIIASNLEGLRSRRLVRRGKLSYLY